MKFTEAELDENFDVRHYKSLPLGLWEIGIIRMLFGKYRVRMSTPKLGGIVTIDYWGGEDETAHLMCGFILGASFHLPEEITPAELEKLFPWQNDKELGPDFWEKLHAAAAVIHAKYPVDGLN